MSKWIRCEICGGLKEVPAFDGDGAYSLHDCAIEQLRPTNEQCVPATGEEEP